MWATALTAKSNLRYLSPMKDMNPDLWAAFEAFARANPDDPGVVMTLALAYWVKEQKVGPPPDPNKSKAAIA